MEDGMIPLFAYGTLQPGEPLYYMAVGSLLYHPASAVVMGYDLHTNSTATYPYMLTQNAKTTPDDEFSLHPVFGSLLIMPTGAAFYKIASMELSAGYELQKVEAYIAKNEGGHRMIEALAFVFPDRRHFDVGERIESGSWTEWIDQFAEKLAENSSSLSDAEVV